MPAQGLAHCFQKTEEGRLSDCFVIEPISASALEVLNLPGCELSLGGAVLSTRTKWSRVSRA